MRRRVPAFALLVLLPCAAAAQSSRDEAIRKMVAGDYQGAAQALRPLTEDPQQPDPAAQFLLALLYDFGQGVPRNVMRACGLYRQAARANGPFRETADALDRMLHEDSPVPDQMCAAGPWNDLPEASFTLGPGHSVHFTSNAIVVRYQGAEQRIGTGNLPGVVPLPVRYTPLDVTQPVRETRHFFQSFFWSPDNPAAPASWELIWGVSEVVAGEFVQGTFVRNVVTVPGVKPPAALDPSTLTRLHVNAAGEVQWVATGPPARSGTIPRKERQ